MRRIAGTLALVYVGWLGVALADPPAATPARSVAASPPSTTAAQPTAPASTPAPAKPAPNATSAPSAQAPDPREQQLISAGYRPQMHNGQKVFCKREGVLGSRTEFVMRCGTVEQLARETQVDREATERGQRNTPWVPQ